MVDDVGVLEVSAFDPKGGASGVDYPKGGASGVDICEIADVDHESLYQVDPYTAVLDGVQKMDVESHHIEIMIDAYRITADRIIEKLKENIDWGSNQQAHLRWWHFNKKDLLKLPKMKISCRFSE
jgi:hypothetical protein